MTEKADTRRLPKLIKSYDRNGIHTLLCLIFREYVEEDFRLNEFEKGVLAGYIAIWDMCGFEVSPLYQKVNAFTVIGEGK